MAARDGAGPAIAGDVGRPTTGSRTQSTGQTRRRGLSAFLWLSHRLSGVVLAGYLYLHLYTLGSAMSGADAFDAKMIRLDHPVYHILNLCLVVVAVYHTLNGIRLIILDAFPRWSHRRSGVAVIVACTLVVAAFVPFFF